MSTRFDGSRFVGLDDEGMSASGSAGRFWDTALDNAIASNAQHLIELGEGATWAPLTRRGGDWNEKTTLRPYTSFNRTAFLVLPWMFPQDAASLQLGLIARVADETGDSKGVQLDFERHNAALTQRIAFSTTNALANSEGATPQFQDYKLTITYPEVQRGDAVGAVVLWVKGSPSAAAIDTTLGGGSNFRSAVYRADDTGFYDETGSARPNADALDVQMTRLTADNTRADHVYYPNLDDPDQLMGVLGPTVPVSNQLARYGLSYMQLKGATLWQRFEDTMRPDPRMFAARKPLLGEVAVLHAIRMDTIHTRPRPLWIGPEGYRPDPEAPEWPDGYTYRFNRVYGDDTQDQTLLSAHVMPDTPNPRIVLMAYVAARHVYPTSNILRALGREASDAITPRIDWEHELVVRQLEDGDASWAAAAARGSSSTIITHFHLPHDESSLLAMSEAYTRYPATSTDIAADKGLGYAYREGQLGEGDLQGLALVTLVVDLTGYDPATPRPVRIDWNVRTQTPIASADFGDPWGGVPSDTAIGDSSVQARDLDTLALVVVGASIWEMPQ